MEKIGERNKSSSASESTANRGKLLVDATVAEQAVKYSTDNSLLNEAREISEHLIDELYALGDYRKKP